MSEELNKGDNWYKTMELATSEINEVKKKYFGLAILGLYAPPQFEECSKEIQAIYDKYGIQVNREGKINKPKEDD